MSGIHYSTRITPTKTSPSGLASLPKELLFKILEQLDDEDVLGCTEILFLNSISVDILLRRNEIQDPAVYCEAEVRLPERLSDSPMTDTLSALLASKRHYDSIKMLHCAVRPSIGYDGMDTSIIDTIPYDSVDLIAEPVEERAEFMFGRIAEFLSRVDSLEAVHLGVAHWRWFPESLSRLLEELLNRIIFEKGCSCLRLDTGLTPLAHGHHWEVSSGRIQAPRPTSSLSRILTKFTCGIFNDRDSDFTTPQESQPSVHVSRLTKLQMDSIFFHPKTLSWISNLFSQSCLVDFTISFGTRFLDNFSSIHDALRILLKTKHFEALTVLRATEPLFKIILACIWISELEGLKRLTVCANTAYWSPSPGRFDGPAPFPRTLETFSISPELIYALPHIIPAGMALKQLEIVYQETPSYLSNPPTINADARSVRECFDRIRECVSIAIKLPMEARHVPANGILPGTPAWRPGLPTVYADAFTRALSFAKRDRAADGGKGFEVVDIFQLDCNPLKLETRESIESCINLVHMFPQVKEVTLHGIRHSWEAWKPVPSYATSESTITEIVRRVYMGCADLTSLQIGEEVYLRPEV